MYVSRTVTAICMVVFLNPVLKKLSICYLVNLCSLRNGHILSQKHLVL